MWRRVASSVTALAPFSQNSAVCRCPGAGSGQAQPWQSKPSTWLSLQQRLASPGARPSARWPASWSPRPRWDRPRGPWRGGRRARTRRCRGWGASGSCPRRYPAPRARRRGTATPGRWPPGSRAPHAVGIRRRAPAVHRRDHRHAEGRDAHAPQPRRERRAGSRVDGCPARHRGRLRRPAVLPRLRPDAVPQLRDPRRRDARRVPVASTPTRVLDAQRRLPGTFLPAVPPMLDRLAGRRGDAGADLTSFRYAISGAMALPAHTAQAWERVTGGLVIEGYGMTETSPVALGNPLTDARRPGTLGLPFPSTEHPRRRPGGRHARRRARRARRAADPGPAGLRRLLGASRGDRRAAARRRLAADRGHRHRRRDRAGSSSSTASRRSSSPAGSRSTRRRSRSTCGPCPGSRTSPSSASPAETSGRPSWPRSCSSRAPAGSTSTPCAPGASGTWRATRCPARLVVARRAAAVAGGQGPAPRGAGVGAGGLRLTSRGRATPAGARARPRASCRGRGPGRPRCRRRTGRRPVPPRRS